MHTTCKQVQPWIQLISGQPVRERVWVLSQLSKLIWLEIEWHLPSPFLLNFQTLMNQCSRVHVSFRASVVSSQLCLDFGFLDFAFIIQQFQCMTKMILQTANKQFKIVYPYLLFFLWKIEKILACANWKNYPWGRKSL